MAQIEQETLNEVVLSEDQVICALTNNPVKATEKELNLQSMILMMTEEYNFALEDMERDFKFKYEDEEGKKKSGKVDLAVFEKGKGDSTSHSVGKCSSEQLWKFMVRCIHPIL